MSEPVLHKLCPVSSCNSRYAVLDNCLTVGFMSKDDDSFMTKHKWKAWLADGSFVGEFDTRDSATEAILNLTKQQPSTKEIL